jgi:hypothetical protein
VSDPKRWSEDGGSELEQELLQAGQSVRLPESERRALWAGISLALPAALPGAVTPATTPLAPSIGVSALFTKGLIFLATVGGLTFGAWQLWPRAQSTSVPTAPATVVVPPQVTTTVREPQAVATAEPTAAPSNPPAPGFVKPRVGSETQLREESLAVLAARSALRAGDAARSLALLEHARVRFPHGALGQEREALTIEALAKSGQGPAASRRAEAFLRSHPSSPYVADVRRIAGK